MKINDLLKEAHRLLNVDARDQRVDIEKHQVDVAEWKENFYRYQETMRERADARTTRGKQIDDALQGQSVADAEIEAAKKEGDRPDV